MVISASPTGWGQHCVKDKEIEMKKNVHGGGMLEHYSQCGRWTFVVNEVNEKGNWGLGVSSRPVLCGP